MVDKVRLTNKPYDAAVTIAANIIQYFDGDCRQEALDALRNDVKQYCEVEERFRNLKDISEKFQRKSRDIETESEIQEQKTVAMRATSKQNLVKEFTEEVDKIQIDTSNNKNMKIFSRQIEQLISSLSDQQIDSNNTDDEMQVRSTVNVICPISKLRMVEPMKNQLCGHSYDKNSVLEMMKHNARTRCPVVGCSNVEYLRPEHLSIDVVTKIYMEKNAA